MTPHSSARKKVGLLTRLSRLCVSIVVLVLIAGVGLYGYFQYDLNQPLSVQTGDTLTVENGDTLTSVGQQLQKMGAIEQTYSLRAYARIQKIGQSLDIGEYALSEGLTLPQLITQISRGEGRVNKRLTLVEGKTFADFRRLLAETEGLLQTTVSLSDKQLMKQLFNSEQHPEGLFFPDSYQFTPGTSDRSILKQAYKLMQTKLDQAWQNRSDKTRVKTPYEALILGSIIEKETGYGPERRKISGVFTNRLNKGMLLQTDPTVIYGVGKSYRGDITRKHLRTDTPYNTYTRRGLTPTPIAMPSLAAIEAALNPETTDAIFFVAKGGGQHYFSKTLREHNSAVRKYLLNR